MNKNEKWTINFARIIEIALGICLAILCLAIIFYIFWAIFHPKLESLTRPIIRNEINLKISNKEKQLLDGLTEKGAISTTSDLVSQLIAFYDTQNAFLLGIMALSGIFGFFYIRQRTRNETEEIMESEFGRYTRTINFQKLITDLVNNSSTITDLNRTADELFGLYLKLKRLEDISEDQIGSVLPNTAHSETLDQNQ